MLCQATRRCEWLIISAKDQVLGHTGKDLRYLFWQECNAFLVLTVPLEYLNKLITIVGLSPRTVQSRAPSDSVLGYATSFKYVKF